ncbi:BatA domain-containing protein [Candidatus Palauibacter sp.]|uniref:BatA domain-containing protein n=1 Tax=Candidatus Palauibacter sp. TaxID=3101350 RepID=UPI003B01BED0
MSLLTPWFLAGLGLLSVPIIIHLTHRQRSRVTVFPSLMFLRKLPFKSLNRRRIRHPLLFALRCLALVLLALAFARPFLDTLGEVEGGSARDVVLVLDVSASMGYADRWEAALDSARAVLDGLGEGDRVAVAAFDEQARERFPLSLDLVAGRTALEGLAPTHLGTRLEAGLQLAGRILAEPEGRAREVALISDYQRTGWEDGGRVRLPDGVALRTASVAGSGDGDGDAAANVALAEAALRTADGGRVRLVARLANMGEGPVDALPVSLEIAGRTVATMPVDMPPRGTGTVVFQNLALPEGRSRASLTIPGDGLVIDDVFRFVAASEAGLRTLILGTNRGSEDPGLFLERALGIGDAPRIEASRAPASGIDAGGLSSADFVVLNDGDLADAGRAGLLRDWVSAGGGLLIVLGPGTRMDRWSTAGHGLLGAGPGPLVDVGEGRRLSWLDYDHPVFELFSTPRSGDFSGARFMRFWEVEPAEGTAVLARFDTGEPALLEHVVGEGRVLVWTSTLDRYWNDLALQPVFLPFVHRLALHATGYREPERWIEAGGTLELRSLVEGGAGAGDRGLVGENGEWVLVDPAGDRHQLEIAEDRTWIDFPETGFYQVEAMDGATAPVTVAVNARIAESDLSPVATERVAETVGGPSPPGEAGEGAAGIDGETVPRRAELWWPLLLLSALVLGVESVLANRWTRRRPVSALTGA